MLIMAAQQAADGGIDWKLVIGMISAGVGLITAMFAVFALWLNGHRAERARRRQLYAGGYAAVQAYKEFAFAVRRRRHDEPEAERVRISEAFRDIQKDLAYHDALIGRERSGRVATQYRNLVAKTREIAGGLIRAGWNSAPITTDAQMNMPEIADALQPIKVFEDAFLQAIEDDLSWRYDLTPRGR